MGMQGRLGHNAGVPSVELPFVATDDLICAVLRGEQPAWALQQNRVDPPVLLDRAAFHGVQALLHARLAGTDWPQHLAAPVRASAIQWAMWELAHQQMLVETLAALHEIRVEPVLIKGSALAYSVYPDPALRTRGDTDLVIPLEAKRQVHDVLTSIGFERHPGVSGEFVSYQASYTRADPITGAHTLDLHWKINNSELLSRLFTYEELRRDAQPLPRLCARALGTSRVHALLLACMHRATHKQNPYYVNGEAHHDADRLIWLYDLHLLAGELTAAEWRRVTQLATHKGLRTVCLEGLQHAQDCFRTSYPQAVATALSEPARAEAPARYLEGSKLRQQWLDFQALGKLSRRLAFLRELLLPPPEYMREKYLDRDSWLAWLYVRRAAMGVVGTLGAGWSQAWKHSFTSNTAIRACAAFFNLNTGERRTVMATALLAPLFAAGVRFLGLRRFRRMLRQPVQADSPVGGGDVLRIANLVRAACNRLPLRVSCLTRSLLLQWLLEREGIRADLRIGVRLVDGGLQAHAWVEREGQPIGETAEVADTFLPFEGALPLQSFVS